MVEQAPEREEIHGSAELPPWERFFQVVSHADEWTSRESLQRAASPRWLIREAESHVTLSLLHTDLATAKERLRSAVRLALQLPEVRLRKSTLDYLRTLLPPEFLPLYEEIIAELPGWEVVTRPKRPVWYRSNLIIGLAVAASVLFVLAYYPRVWNRSPHLQMTFDTHKDIPFADDPPSHLGPEQPEIRTGDVYKTDVIKEHLLASLSLPYGAFFIVDKEKANRVAWRDRDEVTFSQEFEDDPTADYLESTVFFVLIQSDNPCDIVAKSQSNLFSEHQLARLQDAKSSEGTKQVFDEVVTKSNASGRVSVSVWRAKLKGP